MEDAPQAGARSRGNGPRAARTNTQTIESKARHGSAPTIDGTFPDHELIVIEEHNGVSPAYPFGFLPSPPGLCLVSDIGVSLPQRCARLSFPCSLELVSCVGVLARFRLNVRRAPVERMGFFFGTSAKNQPHRHQQHSRYQMSFHIIFNLTYASPAWLRNFATLMIR